VLNQIGIISSGWDLSGAGKDVICSKWTLYEYMLQGDADDLHVIKPKTTNQDVRLKVLNVDH
jgi:hypothetical protein